MKGLTATGITVGICAGTWQLISSAAGMDPNWGFLGTVGFIGFASFYAAGGKKDGLAKSLIVNYTGIGWAALAAFCSGLLVTYLGITGFWAGVITTVPFSACIVWQGRFKYTSFIPGGFFGMIMMFASGLNWPVVLVGFLAGNIVGFISEFTGSKLSEVTSRNKKPEQDTASVQPSE